MKIERFDEIYLRYYRLSLKVAYSVVHDNEVWYELIRRVSVNEENPVSVASDYGISVAYLRTQISRARHWMAEELRRQGND